jgi:hypothetical protein
LSYRSECEALNSLQTETRRQATLRIDQQHDCRWNSKLTPLLSDLYNQYLKLPQPSASNSCSSNPGPVSPSFVAADIQLPKLHKILQAVMSWDDGMPALDHILHRSFS